MKYVFLAIVFLPYLFISVKYQIRIIETVIWSRKQKIWNSLLLWLVPYIWAILIKEALEPIGGSVKSDRKKRSSGSDVGSNDSTTITF